MRGGGRIRRRWAAVAVAVAAAFVAAPPASAGEWLAGDLHVHTTYSHDSWGGPGDDNTGPEEAYTLGNTVPGQFTAAGARGLDYLAITDHNDVRSQAHFADPGVAASGVIPVPGYENSLSGHAQMLGATGLVGSGTAAPEVQAAADELRAAGGAFQINHPAEGATGDELDWALGHAVVPDTVEVWNISRLWQPPLPSASNNDEAIRFWEGFLDRGERVAATGGSDNHDLATQPIQGPGQPTTWVYAEEPSAAGVLAGLRRGHTFVSHQPPALGGPRVFLEADGDGNGSFESIAGDAVEPGSRMRVRVRGATGARLRLIADHGRQFGSTSTVGGDDYRRGFQPPASATWVRAEVLLPDGEDARELACDALAGAATTYCRNALGTLAMTSAIYLRPA